MVCSRTQGKMHYAYGDLGSESDDDDTGEKGLYIKSLTPGEGPQPE